MAIDTAIYSYTQLAIEIHKLKGEQTEEELVEIFSEYIYNEIPDTEILKIIKANKSQSILTLHFMMTAIAGSASILTQTIKITELMKTSKDWKEFESKAKKKEKPLTDFDKILKGILQVPKPKDKETEK